MNRYLAETTITLFQGLVLVTEPQLRRRAHLLEKLDVKEVLEGHSICRITNQIQFKAGEEFGYQAPEGDPPKRLMDGMSLLEEGEAFVPVTPAGSREHLINEAIASMDPDNPDLWTASGAPDLRALNDAAGLNPKVSSEERDTVFAEHWA